MERGSLLLRQRDQVQRVHVPGLRMRMISIAIPLGIIGRIAVIREIRGDDLLSFAACSVVSLGSVCEIHDACAPRLVDFLFGL